MNSVQNDKQQTISKINFVLLGFTAGMITTYFIDPVRGKRRRIVLKDQFLARSRDLGELVQRVAKDISNRIHGIVVSYRSPISPDVDDETLKARVRTYFGRLVRHTRSIQTTVQDGVVTLSGPILEDEVDRVIECVQQVPGVKSVINQLEVHATPDGVSGLQGDGPNYLQ